MKTRYRIEKFVHPRSESAEIKELTYSFAIYRDNMCIDSFNDYEDAKEYMDNVMKADRLYDDIVRYIQVETQHYSIDELRFLIGWYDSIDLEKVLQYRFLT
jgi:hypothetical protein